MLYYLPLESYKARYTMQWSAPKVGWLERRWNEHGVEYTRIEGIDPEAGDRPITVGSVLDVSLRTEHCFAQISQIIRLANEGKVTSDDVIYMDDFWTPGLEALAYAFHILKIKPKMFAFCHAQSVDEFDFTHPMRNWMRPIETGYGKILDGIFVSCNVLKDLLVQGGVADESKVHVTRFPFAADEVMERMYGKAEQSYGERENTVVFSSRWDPEKNPKFFLEVAEQVISIVPDVKFVICTGSDSVKSTDPELLAALLKACAKYPFNIVIKSGLKKEEYYKELTSAKIQMNTASQDFVSITLLESAVAGCYPLYPYFRSFPEALEHRTEYMYEMLDVTHATAKIVSILKRDDLWDCDSVGVRNQIFRRHSQSWITMLNLMGIPIKTS